MPLSSRDFEALLLPGEPGDLPYRVMALLKRSADAYTPGEIGEMLGDRGWGRAFNPRVAVADLPAVQSVLDALVEQGHAEVRVKDGLAGSERYYRRKQPQPATAT